MNNKINKCPIVIGVNGGTASGKTTFAEKIRDMLLSTGHKTVMISHDSFYRNLTKEQLDAVKYNNYNFDHPDAVDFSSMIKVLKELIIKGSEDTYVEIPIYDFNTHQRSSEVMRVKSGDSIIIEGLFIFSDPELRSLIYIKLFVDVDDDTRLARRIRRDIMSRGRDVTQVLNAYEKFVKPGYHFFIEPYKRYADIIVPYGGHNEIAVGMISQYLRRLDPLSF
ncbi:MAG: uridine kinase [Candidatus Paceibacterota bacterium]